MNLILRPCRCNDAWSIVWCLLILLAGVAYYIINLYNASQLDEMKDGDLTNKDAEQDTKIAVIDSTLDNIFVNVKWFINVLIDNEDMKNFPDRIRHGTLGCWYWSSNCCGNIHHRHCSISRFKGDRSWEQWFHPTGSRVTTSA